MAPVAILGRCSNVRALINEICGFLRPNNVAVTWRQKKIAIYQSVAYFFGATCPGVINDARGSRIFVICQLSKFYVVETLGSANCVVYDPLLRLILDTGLFVLD